jgi:endonuclease YncB( thermonuclease family)
MPLFRRRRRVWGFVALVFVVAAAWQRLEPPPPPVGGHAFVVDGDTLRLGGERVRLLGIDAPERAQTCTDASGAPWPCGEAARRYLEGLLEAGDIACQPQGRDRYGRLLAHCRQGGDDLSRQVVRAGLAVADGEYIADAATAQAARTGIWAGSFEPPSVWRREHREPSSGAGWWDAIRQWFG